MKKLEEMTEPELGRLMNGCCLQVQDVFAREGVEKPLFCLLVFNDPKAAQYAGNCQRADVVKAMRECAARLEGREDVTR